MAVGGSPAVARYRLRVALREAREAKGLTQRQVADALDWSLSKVNRIELGEVTVSTTDLRALLGLYGVSDAPRVQDLIGQARTARNRSRWDDPQYRENLSQATIETFQFEADASEIRIFQPTLVPGLLQTPAYASAVLKLYRDEWSEPERVARVDSRSRRRELVFNRPDPPQYLVAMDESVLMRQMGGPRVMSEQLYELVGHANAGRVMIRVVPLADVSGFAAVWSVFMIFTINGESVMMYRENYNVDETLHDTRIIALHRERFDQIWEHSLPVEASIHLIEAHAANLRAKADRAS